MEAESIKDSLQSGRDARSLDKKDAEAAVPLKPSVDKEMKNTGCSGNSLFNWALITQSRPA